jgi:TldD protein
MVKKAVEDSLSVAESLFFHRQGLSQQKVIQALSELSINTIDYADFYFHQAYAESWMLEERIVKSGSYSVDQGVGIRAVSGEKTGFAFSNDLSLSAILDAVKATKCIVRSGQNNAIPLIKPKIVTPLYLDVNPLKTLTEEQKVSLLQATDNYARQYDPRVAQVVVSLSGAYEIILVMAIDGTFSADIRPMVRLNVSVIVEDHGKREQGFCGGGGRQGYELFDAACLKHYAHEAARMALVNLEAKEAPAGVMPVVLGAGWPAVLLHEAVGHGLEGDFNRKKSSVYAGKIGKKVASKYCTIVDDGTLANRRGSLSIDDEGTPTQCTTLIEKGILKGYMLDKMNARLMGMKTTGNARRESFAHIPMPRMTNTYMQPGKYAPEEIIASVDRGIYAPNFSGGQVDITSGKFVFSTSEAYLIENGKITTPIKGVTLIGDGQEVLQKISMVGNDLAMDGGVGVCGKDGQSVPVGVGQPTIKIDALTVGGTKA